MVVSNNKLGYINLGLYCSQSGEQEGEAEGEEWWDFSSIGDTAPDKGIKFN